MPLYFDSLEHIKSQKKPYANRLWLGRLDGSSNLIGGNRGLGYNLRARGVKITAKGGHAEKKVIETYTPRQITKALKKLEFSGLEKQLIKELKKID